LKSVPVFCGKDCGGVACPLLAVVEDGQVRRVTHNPAGGKYLKGCWRGLNLALETYAADRILTPLVRVGARGSGQFRQASWDEALEITAGKLDEIRAKYGATAVLNRSSAGGLGALHCTFMLLGRFLNLYGGCTRLTCSYSSAAANFILPYLLGKEWAAAGFDPATMQYAQMIGAVGGQRARNPPGQRGTAAPGAGQTARGADRGDRPAPFGDGQAGRHLVDPLPPRHGCGPDAGRAARDDH
jgi:anaerobic dimethyl sulfoxide reductase subunit A